MYLRANSESKLVLFPPHPNKLPKSWIAYILLSRPWRFVVEVLEQTLLGYNFVFDDTKRIRLLELSCVRASQHGLPDFDLQGRRIVTTGLPTSTRDPALCTFFASYSSFAIKSTLLEGLGKTRMETIAFCVSSYGGTSAIIVEQGLDWRPVVVRWINEKTNSDMVAVVRKKGPSFYQFERILARLAV